MIKISGSNLNYDTAHLLTRKPETFKDIISRLEGIDVSLFYNIVSSPECYYEKNFSKGRIQEHYRNMSAEDRFCNIFSEKKLYANPKSFFVNKITKMAPHDCDAIKSVSFAFSSHEDLPRHFKARGSEFGICFFHDFLQNKGLRQVEYINDSDNNRKSEIIFNSPHLLEVYTNSYNMRWEKEWRLSADLDFKQEDIAFVIVPEDCYEKYVDFFYNHEDFEEMAVVSSNVFTSYIDHAITHPTHSTNSWNQVEILATKESKGFKIDGDTFGELTNSQKDKFANKYALDLRCFAKNTLLSIYERKYVERFLHFSSALNADSLNIPIFDAVKLISTNVKEPDDAERDLLKAIFGDLYMEFAKDLYPDEL